MDDKFFIWEGVYRDFDAAPGSSGAFREATWSERSRQKALRLRERSRSGGYTPITNASHVYCLPVIVALAQAERQRIRLLDFGGCAGFTFHSVIEALGRPEDIEYHIVDNEAVCQMGREVFFDEPRIIFHEAVPDGPFDIV